VTGERKTACITGATSGIGEVFARRFASDGYDLIITGRREDKIGALAEELTSSNGIHAEVVIAEFADPDDVHKLVQIIMNTDNLSVLVNNAGFGTEATYFHEGNLEVYVNMVTAHTTAAMQITHAALPGMISRGEGIVVNVASVAAFLVFPRSHVYSATKAFLNFFTEGLHMELEGTGVKVQSLCPGFTKTDFHPRMGWDKSRMRSRGIVKWMSAEDVVETSLEYLEKNKAVCIPGFWNRLFVRLLPLLPRKLYYRIAVGTRDRERGSRSDTGNH
jgi:short-subunit dehydrogenase